MLDPLSLKSDVLFHLRDTLRAQGFREAITPVARRADLGPGRRAPVDLTGGRFLRAMIGPALRMNLEHHTRVFEIGPCFRPEEPDRLHAAEFTMLDLYAAHEEYAFLLDLAKQLVAAHLPYTPVQISVGDYIRDVFGIDLRREPVGDLPRQMADRLGLGVDTPFKDTLGQFVERELETQSVNAAVFLVDYPLGGDEPCARLKRVLNARGACRQTIVCEHHSAGRGGRRPGNTVGGAKVRGRHSRPPQCGKPGGRHAGGHGDTGRRPRDAGGPDRQSAPKTGHSSVLTGSDQLR